MMEIIDNSFDIRPVDDQGSLGEANIHARQ